MISLFDHKSRQEEEEIKRRDVYITRLQEIAGVSTIDNPSAVESSGGATTSDRPETPSSVGIAPQKTEDAEAAMAGSTQLPGHLGGHGFGNSDEFQKVAEQITPRLVDALTGAVKEVHRLAVSDQGKLESTAAEVARVSERIEKLTGELDTLRRQADSLTQAERSLSLKLARIEANFLRQEEAQQKTREELLRMSAGQEEIRHGVERQAGAISALEEGQKSLEGRMSAHAEVIRGLHASEQNLGDRREEFRATLRRLEEILDLLPKSKPLPEGF